MCVWMMCADDVHVWMTCAEDMHMQTTCVDDMCGRRADDMHVIPGVVIHKIGATQASICLGLSY